MLAPRGRCLHHSIVHCDVTERWLLTWNQNTHVIYYIFHILIPKSVLVFHTFAPNSFDDSGFIIVQLWSVIYRLPFWSLPQKLYWHSHIVRLTMKNHIFLEFWFVDTWFLCRLTSPPCRNLPQKCTPVKFKKRQKAGFPIVT